MLGKGNSIEMNGDRHAEKRKHSDLEEDDDFSSTGDTDEDISGLDDYISSEDSDFKVQYNMFWAATVTSPSKNGEGTFPLANRNLGIHNLSRF